MIALAPAPAAAIDDAIDDAVSRIRDRADALGGGFSELGAAIARATAGGKRFRPALVAAAFEAFGGSVADARGLYPVAAAFELLHTAFVVHDDVIDHDTVRRGIPNVAGEFRLRGRARGADAAGAALLGDAAAILAGDLLLHEACRLVAMADATPSQREALLGLVDDAVFISAAGELADVENAVSADYADSEALLAAAHDKTAVYSFTAPLSAGAVLAGAPAEAIAALAEAGRHLGLAFQLADDLIGAFGTADQAGRESGGDLREAKRTPLIGFARESDAWSRVNEAISVAHTGPIAVREAQLALDESGARTRLVALVDEALGEARIAASDPALPADAARLVSTIAGEIARRIP
ncbi:polyprenyl synthetase family protein [Microbacterium sp. BK668]|uniref:polyprenyl synthetase family protein n=1 Tax=Microbacterium sp. BK668 TaxID=2512118 RepID=UPI001061738B|nr:polyprenyl synthetase family protein [Microbacterium sp. BK668]TDN92523.1 geranylgeranyl diphosphate synthase type II [Microbacterium sp. BK668]